MDVSFQLTVSVFCFVFLITIIVAWLAWLHLNLTLASAVRVAVDPYGGKNKVYCKLQFRNALREAL